MRGVSRRARGHAPRVARPGTASTRRNALALVAPAAPRPGGSTPSASTDPRPAPLGHPAVGLPVASPSSRSAHLGLSVPSLALGCVKSGLYGDSESHAGPPT